MGGTSRGAAMKQSSSADGASWTARSPTAMRVANLVRVGSREIEDVLARSSSTGRLKLRGGPVLALPPHIREAAMSALSEPDRRPARGLPELRQAIAGMLGAETGHAVDPDRELLMTNGAMQGLSTVFRSLLDVGDEVIVPTPAFFFDGAIQLAGAIAVHVPCREEADWALNIEDLRHAVSPRTRMILLCNPNNPTGYLPTRQDLAAVLTIAREHNLVVVSDECFSYANYGEQQHIPLASFVEDADRLVTVRSLSKSHALGSWRIGYLHASPALIDIFADVVEWECLHCGYVQQRVATAAVSGPQDWLAGTNEAYRYNRDRLLESIGRSQWITSTRPLAGPFLFPNLSRAEAATGTGAFEQLLALGVPTVPGRYFHAPGHVRLPFGGDADTLDRLVDILEHFSPSEGIVDV